MNVYIIKKRKLKNRILKKLNLNKNINIVFIYLNRKYKSFFFFLHETKNLETWSKISIINLFFENINIIIFR